MNSYRKFRLKQLSILILLFCQQVLFAQQPKLMFPIGHTSYINSIDFSQDNAKVVTASTDNTAKIWDAATGNFLTDLKGHSAALLCARFSPDGKKIATASLDHTAKIWDATTGRLLIDIKAHDLKVNSICFSPNGKHVVTASVDRSVKIWNALNGQLEKELHGHGNWVNNALFSPDGKKIITCSYDKSVIIWDADNGKILETLAHKGPVISAKYSADGKTILTVCRDNIASIWDERGNLLREIKFDNRPVETAMLAAHYELNPTQDKVTDRLVQFSPDGKKLFTLTDNTIKQFSTSTGNLTGEEKIKGDSIHSISLSRDGKYIITTSSFKASIRYENSGLLISELKGHTQGIYSVTFSPNGKTMITYGNVKRLWNAENGRLIAKSDANLVENLIYSPDGSVFMSSVPDSDYKIYNTFTGRLQSSFADKSMYWVQYPCFSADSKLFMITTDSSINIFNVMSGELITRLSFNNDMKPLLDSIKAANPKMARYQLSLASADRAIFSSDSKNVLTISDSIIKLYDVYTGKLKNIVVLQNNTFTPEIVTRYENFPAKNTKLSVSPNDQFIITSSFGFNPNLWNAVSGEKIIELKKNNNVEPIFSPDSKLLAVVTDDNKATIYNTVNGKWIADLKGHTKLINKIVFSTNGSQVFTISYDGTLKTWDAATGTLLRTIQAGKNEILEDIDRVNNIAAGIDNGEINFYDINSGNKLYSLLPIDSLDYLAYDANGRYDGTQPARKMLHFMCGTEIIELDQLKEQLWVNNLVERLMKKDSINARKLNDLNICGLTPAIEILKTDSTQYKFKITPGRGGLGDIFLLINGIEAERYKPWQLTRRKDHYELMINKKKLQDILIPGRENLLSLKANTENNDVSSRGIIIKEKNDKLLAGIPNLYAVMIGVSDYKDDELNLKYAADDAISISSAVSNASKKMLNTDTSEHVFMYNLTTTKERYLFPEKKSIKKVLEMIGAKARANDILLIFFAGHGMMDGIKKQFYFLTADASRSSATGALKDVGISTSELISWITPDKIKAQKRVLIFDACNSGQAINDIAGATLAVRNDDNSQQIKAIDQLNEKSGLFILSASETNQHAYEMGMYSHGLLTYGLLKAIKQEPDILEEGKYLDISRWFHAAEKTVTQISRENGTKQNPTVLSNTNFNLGVIDDDVKAKILLPNKKSLFTTSIFVDPANNDDHLEFSQQLNETLIYASNNNSNNLIYIENTNSPDAYALRGTYDIKDEEIIFHVKLKQGKYIKQSFEIKGVKANLKQLSYDMLSKVEKWLNE